MPLDVDRLADAMLEGVQALIAKAIAPLSAANETLRAENKALADRLSDVEGREVDLSPVMSRIDGVEAKMIDADTVREIAAAAQPEPLDVGAIVADAVKSAVEEIPPAKDGKDFDPAEIEAMRGEIEEVRKAIPEIPAAPDVSNFATKAEITEAIAAIPEPVPYDETEIRKDIAALRSDLGAIHIPDAIPGKDGVSVAEVKQNDDGELIVKMTSGETHNAGKVRGADGLGFAEMTVEDGEREFALVFTKGDRTVRHTLAKSGLFYQGVWKEGEFKSGDAVTLAGSVWIAQKDTDEKPGTSDAWRLAVKKGRDGKDVVSLPKQQGPVKI